MSTSAHAEPAAPRPATMQAVFERYHKRLYAFLRKHTRDEDLAKDLTQDVFVKALLHLDTLADTTRLESWLYRIARTTLADHYKKHRPGGPLPDLAAEQEEEGHQASYVHCLPEMMAQLDAKYREALELELRGDVPQLQAAKRMGLSYSGAKSRIQRARMQLEALFRERCHYTADVYGHVIDDACSDPCGCGTAAGV